MTHLNTALLVACAVFSSAAYAQNQEPSQPPAAPSAAQSQQEPSRPSAAPPSAQAGQSDSSSVSITGCLTKAGDSGAYVITDQKTGQKYPFAGPAQLDKFVNQTVTLSGTMNSQAGGNGFRPSRIAPVATTCEKAQ